jgi:curved DNA-binding protein
MQFKDYYQVLGVEPSASEDDIRTAFRRLARKHHPDLNPSPDAAARMQELNEAHEVLRDPEKRAAYDRVAQGVDAEGTFRPPPGWDSGYEFSGGPAEAADSADHSAFFEALFGAMRRGEARGHTSPGHGAARARRGEDHHARIVVPLEDAFHGATRDISLHRPEPDGSGRVVMQERTLRVAIPKGIHVGQQIRLAGQGSAGFGDAPAGDLYLEVSFAPHPRWRVDGRDLYTTLRVAPWEAALGAGVSVPTPDGTVELTVPAGSQSGRRLRLRGRGIPGKPPGDCYVVLQVVLPPANDESARAAYRRMAADLAFDPRADLGADA